MGTERLTQGPWAPAPDRKGSTHLASGPCGTGGGRGGGRPTSSPAATGLSPEPCCSACPAVGAPRPRQQGGERVGGCGTAGGQAPNGKPLQPGSAETTGTRERTREPLGVFRQLQQDPQIPRETPPRPGGPHPKGRHSQLRDSPRPRRRSQDRGEGVPETTGGRGREALLGGRHPTPQLASRDPGGDPSPAASPISVFRHWPEAVSQIRLQSRNEKLFRSRSQPVTANSTGTSPRGRVPGHVLPHLACPRPGPPRTQQLPCVRELCPRATCGRPSRLPPARPLAGPAATGSPGRVRESATEPAACLRVHPQLGHQRTPARQGWAPLPVSLTRPVSRARHLCSTGHVPVPSPPSHPSGTFCSGRRPPPGNQAREERSLQTQPRARPARPPTDSAGTARTLAHSPAEAERGPRPRPCPLAACAPVCGGRDPDTPAQDRHSLGRTPGGAAPPPQQ